MKAGEKRRARRSGAGRAAPLAAELLPVGTCPACGSEVDLWTGGEETRCPACDRVIYRKQRLVH